MYRSLLLLRGYVSSVSILSLEIPTHVRRTVVGVDDASHYAVDEDAVSLLDRDVHVLYVTR